MRAKRETYCVGEKGMNIKETREKGGKLRRKDY